jgi:hypothetical protein
MMTIPEILKELEPYTGRFPMKAMEAVIEQREAITPELLRVLEAVAENPPAFARRQDYTVHLFALFLLAQFREKRACCQDVQRSRRDAVRFGGRYRHRRVEPDFSGTLKRSHSRAWKGQVCAVGDLPAPELLEEVRQGVRGRFGRYRFCALGGN